MITLVEALNYRCLQYVRRPLQPFHVLVGSNASGKTTFFDAVGFLGDLLSKGLDAAVEARTCNPRELLFRGRGDKLELAVEARIPDELRRLSARPELDTARYRVVAGFGETDACFDLKAETLTLKKAEAYEPRQLEFFPAAPAPPPDSLADRAKGDKIVVNKVPGGNDNFYREIGNGRPPSFKLGPEKSALGNLPADEESFPAAVWLQEYLTKGVQRLALNSLALKSPSPYTRVPGFLPDGSNLPRIVARMKKGNPRRHREWIAHLQTALPDLKDISVFERPEDKHCYMIYKYAGGLKVPSRLVSDGTLQLTALTLPAYLPDLWGSYFIEEPENGIHPKDTATAYDSLCSMYEAQVLLETHSPEALNAVKTDDVLCFARNDDGATDVVPGSEHPMLQDWQGETALGTLFASGALG